MNTVRVHEQIAELDQASKAWPPGSAIHPVQVSPGLLDLELNGAVSPDLSVFNLKVAPRLIDHQLVSDCQTSFMLAERPMIFMGVTVAPPVLIVSHSNRDYRSVLEPGFRSVEFVLSNNKLGHGLLGELLADARDRGEYTLVPLSDERAEELRSAAKSYISLVDGTEEMALTHDVELVVERRVICALTKVLLHHRGLVPKAVRAGSTVALAALREIERGGYDQNINDICGRLSVSRRAVEKSFQGLLGISPAQYLLACRLNRFRQSLLSTADQVADGLVEAGLPDASRAARQYQRLFDELPSATLRRARQSIGVG